MAEVAIAHVGHIKDGLYSASVEYEPATPFGSVIGPADVSVEEAVQWARRHAKVVRVRTEEATFSAGDVAAGELPAWPGAQSAPRPNARRAPAQPWEVEGHVGSRAEELADVARRLGEALERDERTSDCRHWLQEWGLAVAFTICCPPADRYEIGSRVLRDSWAAADIPSHRIEPYTVSSVSVRRVE